MHADVLNCMESDVILAANHTHSHTYRHTRPHGYKQTHTHTHTHARKATQTDTVKHTVLLMYSIGLYAIDLV